MQALRASSWETRHAEQILRQPLTWSRRGSLLLCHGVAGHVLADVLFICSDMMCEQAFGVLHRLVVRNNLAYLSFAFAFVDFGKICLFNNLVVKGLSEHHVDLGGHLSGLNLSGPHLKAFIIFILEEDAVSDTSHSGNCSKEFHFILLDYFYVYKLS